MLRSILFTSLPLRAEAAYLDPSLQQQKPLLDSKPASGRVIPLTLDQNLHYTYTISSHEFSPTPLEHLQESATTYEIKSTHKPIVINIPLNASLPGTATFFTTPEPRLWPQSTHQFTWTQQRPPNPQLALGAYIPLLGIGIRKGGMISMPTEYATLDLSTPYIHVPKGIWDVLLLATNTKQQARDEEEELHVDCGALNVYPDLVFGVERRDPRETERVEEDDGEVEEEGDDDIEELIIRPEQYVMQTSEGKCVLLARNAESCLNDRATVKLGWAAVRGRDVVLDRRGGRVGFGKPV